MRRFLAIFLILAAPALLAGTAPAPKKVLYFTKSSNFEHSVVRRKDGKPSFSEQVLALTGPRHGIEFTFAKDGSLFTPEYLAQFDAVMFYTSGNLCETGKDGNPAITLEGKTALLDAIRAGKLGFIGIHSATDTFHTGETSVTNTNQPRIWRYENFGDKGDPYTRMIGSSFIIHDKQQVATALVIDPHFPGVAHLGEKCVCMEEWYSLNDFNRDIHVILATQTAGMSGPPYERPNFPNTWAHLHGKGRVYYTALGHREDTWISASFQKILYGGIAWATRQVDADITPNIEKVTPGAWILPPVSGPVAGLPKAEQAALQSTQVPPTGTND